MDANSSHTNECCRGPSRSRLVKDARGIYSFFPTRVRRARRIDLLGSEKQVTMFRIDHGTNDKIALQKLHCGLPRCDCILGCHQVRRLYASRRDNFDLRGLCLVRFALGAFAYVCAAHSSERNPSAVLGPSKNLAFSRHNRNYSLLTQH